MTQEFRLGQVVRSKAGRDKDRLFVVWNIHDSFVYLVDGELRKVENPKRKNIKHLQGTNIILGSIAEKLSASEKITNAEVRRLVADLEGTGAKDC